MASEQVSNISVAQKQESGESKYLSVHILRWGLLLVFLALWELGARTGFIDTYFYSSPSRIIETLIQQFSSGAIWKHLAATMQAAIFGLIYGFIAGAALGWLAARFKTLSQIVEPVMTLFNSVPRIVIAPMIIMWLGIGIASKIAVAFILVFVVLFFAVYTGIREVNKDLIDRIRLLGGNERDIILNVYVPSVAAWIFSSLRLTVGFAFTGGIVGEYMASSRGLGYMLNFAQNSQNADLMLSTVVLIMAIIMLIFALLGRLEARALIWREDR